MTSSSDEPSAQQEAPISGEEWQSIWEQYIDPEHMRLARERLPENEAIKLAEEILKRQKCEPHRSLAWFATRCQLILAISLRRQDKPIATPKDRETALREIATQCREFSDTLPVNTQHLDTETQELLSLLSQQIGAKPDSQDNKSSDQANLLGDIANAGDKLTQVTQLIERLRTDLQTLNNLAGKAAEGQNSVKQRYRTSRASNRERDFFIHDLSWLFILLVDKPPSFSKNNADEQEGKFVWLLRQLIPRVEPHWNIASLRDLAQLITRDIKNDQKLGKSPPDFLMD